MHDENKRSKTPAQMSALALVAVAILVAVLVVTLVVAPAFSALSSRSLSDDGAQGADSVIEADRPDAGTGADASADASVDTDAGTGADASADTSVGVGSGASSGSDSGSGGAFIRTPPFALPVSLRPDGYSEGEYTETWWAVSEASCREVARSLLIELRDSGMELVKADYLDLFGEAWGCTLKDGEEASLTVVLVPKKPFRQRNASNPLRMTLTRTATPELDLSTEVVGEGQ